MERKRGCCQGTEVHISLCLRINKEHSIDPDTSSAAILLSTVLRARSNGGGGGGGRQRMVTSTVLRVHVVDVSAHLT